MRADWLCNLLNAQDFHYRVVEIVIFIYPSQPSKDVIAMRKAALALVPLRPTRAEILPVVPVHKAFVGEWHRRRWEKLPEWPFSSFLLMGVIVVSRCSGIPPLGPREHSGERALVMPLSQWCFPRPNLIRAGNGLYTRLPLKNHFLGGKLVLNILSGYGLIQRAKLRLRAGPGR